MFLITMNIKYRYNIKCNLVFLGKHAHIKLIYLVRDFSFPVEWN